MFILYMYMCIYIGDRIFFLYNKKKKILFVFTAKGFFSPSHSKKVAKPLCSFAPGALGCWMESQMLPEASFILFFRGMGHVLESYTHWGDYTPSHRVEEKKDNGFVGVAGSGDRTEFWQQFLETSRRKEVWVVFKGGSPARSCLLTPSEGAPTGC